MSNVLVLCSHVKHVYVIHAEVKIKYSTKKTTS